MSVVIVGAGGVGLLLAGRIALAGTPVALIARPSLAPALEVLPPRLRTGRDVQFAAGVIPATGLSDLPPAFHAPDLAILCVKAYDIASSLPLLDALRPRVVLAMQSGLDGEDWLAEALGAERVIGGALTAPVEVEAPGCIVVSRAAGIGLAAVGGCAPVDHAAGLLRRAGFPVRTYADHRRLRWSRTLMMMAGSGAPAILGAPTDAVLADPRLAALERRALLEALAVMRHLGVAPVNLPGVPVALLAAALRPLPEVSAAAVLRRLTLWRSGDPRPPIYGDLLRGRRHSESDAVYGAIAAAADRLGVLAPVNRTLAMITRGIAAGEIPWRLYRRQPEALLAAVRRGEVLGAALAPTPSLP